MTSSEFSSEFDILYNNIMSNKAPGLDEYEKSVFLTKAQLEIVMNHFNPMGNKYGKGIDGNTKRQIELSELIDSASIETLASGETFDKRGHLFALPEKTLLILNESFEWTLNAGTAEESTQDYQVFPISFDEYFRLMSKPYKAPLKNQVWRLLKDNASNGVYVEIIPHRKKDGGTSPKYTVRYVRKPNPIILTDISDLDVTIDGIDVSTECELNPLIHREILDRAVELAKAAYLGDINTTIEINKRNE